MKLHKSVYRVIFLLFIIVQVVYHSVEVSVLLSGLLLFVLLAIEPLKVSRSFSIMLTYLIAIIVVGVITSFFYDYELFDRIRDFTHFIKPILVCFLAYLLVIRVDNVRYVLRLIVWIGVFLAIKHFVMLAIADLPDEFRIDRIRAKAGAGSFMELVSLIIVVAFRKENRIFGTQTRKLFIILMSISFVLYFSRTMILGLIILLLSIYGFTKLTRKAFEYSAVVFFIFGLFYASLYMLDLQEGKEGWNRFLLKIRDSPTEVFAAPKGYDPRKRDQVYKHWRGFEAQTALRQMEGSPFYYISGKGFGALVDLGFNAPLGTSEKGLRYIPHLHNGYVYILFKVGVIGLLLYLVLLFNLYKQVYIKSNSASETILRQIISGFGLYFFLSTLVITGIYNLGEISIFCVGIFLALAELEVRKSKARVHE